MNKYIFRNPDLYQELPWRRWFRGEFPEMPFPQVAGLSVEDIDLVTTLFGKHIDRNPRANGKFKIIEIKQGNAQMDYGQRRIYALIDGLLRKGDPDSYHYEGFYLMRWSPPRCSINNRHLDMDELTDFFLNKYDIEPLTTEQIMTIGDVLYNIDILEI